MSENPVDGGRRRRDEGIPNFLEGNPSRMELIPNPEERNPSSNPHFPSSNLAFSTTYADPRSIIVLEANFGGSRQGRRVLPLVHRLLSSFFGSSGCLSKGGLAPFFKIADARAPFVRFGGRAADEREKGTPRSGKQKPPGSRGKRQADRSDVRHGIRPQKARTGFEPFLNSGWAPALHAASVS